MSSRANTTSTTRQRNDDAVEGDREAIEKALERVPDTSRKISKSAFKPQQKQRNK